jgi:hypothetical protein
MISLVVHHIKSANSRLILTKLSILLKRTNLHTQQSPSIALVLDLYATGQAHPHSSNVFVLLARTNHRLILKFEAVPKPPWTGW